MLDKNEFNPCFFSMYPFHNSGKHETTFDFWIFLGGIKREHWEKVS